MFLKGLFGFWVTEVFQSPRLFVCFLDHCVLSRGVHLCLVTTVVGNISGQNIGTSVHQIELTIHRPLTATTKCLCVDPRLAYGRKTCDNRSLFKMSNLPFMGKKSREGFFIACTKCSVITLTNRIRRNIFQMGPKLSKPSLLLWKSKTIVNT